MSFLSMFYEAVWKSVSITQNIALILIPLFLLINIGSHFISALFKNESPRIDYYKIFVGILLWVLVSNYQGPVKLVISVIDSAIELTSQEEESLQHAKVKNRISRLTKTFSFVPEKKSESNLDPMAAINPLMFIGTQISTVGSLLMREITSVFVDGFTSVVYYIVYYLSALLVGMLILVGPLALTFELLPGVGDGNLVRWISSLIHTKCWILTMHLINILMQLFLQVTINMKVESHPLATLDYNFSIVIVNVVFVIMYLMTPILTGYYIRMTGAAMHTAMISAGSTAVSVGTAAASGGASLGGLAVDKLKK